MLMLGKDRDLEPRVKLLLQVSLSHWAEQVLAELGATAPPLPESSVLPGRHDGWSRS